MAALDDLHGITTLSGCLAIWPQIVENEHVSRHQGPEHARKSPVAMGEFDFGEEPRYPMVEDGEVVAAGPLTQGAGKPSLPDTAGTGDDQVALVGDPLARGQAL